MSATTLIDDLARERLVFERVPHPHTESAGEEAAVLGLDAEEVGKTLVLAAGDHFVRVLLPASRRLDLRKVRDVLEAGKEVRLATEAELAGAYPMFELGAVPPFGGPRDDLVVDTRIAARDTVVLEAGTHEESLRCRPGDLIDLAQAKVADVSRTDEEEDR